MGGWAQVNNGPVYKMVMSIGTNPYFNNEKRTMETFIIHKFSEDFYGSNLKTIIIGFIRPMTSYTNLDELVKAIKDDISKAESLLEQPENQIYKMDHFFSNQFKSKV